MATENEYVNNLFQEIEMPNENETLMKIITKNCW